MSQILTSQNVVDASSNVISSTLAFESGDKIFFSMLGEDATTLDGDVIPSTGYTFSFDDEAVNKQFIDSIVTAKTKEVLFLVEDDIYYGFPELSNLCCVIRNAE